MKEMDILGAGMANWDVTMAMEGFPQEDGKFLARRCLMHGGGPCATAMVAAVRLGAKAAFAGVVGEDEAGRLVAGELAGHGVDITLLRAKAGAFVFNAIGNTLATPFNVIGTVVGGDH